MSDAPVAMFWGQPGGQVDVNQVDVNSPHKNGKN